MRRLRLLTTRVLLGNILVAALTSVIGVLLLVLVLVLWLPTVSPGDYRGLSMLTVTYWLMEMPDGQPCPLGSGYPDGFSLVLAPDNKVLFSQGDTTCRAGKALAECAPDLVSATTGERFFQKNGQRWTEVVLDTVTGQRVVSHWGSYTTELSLGLPGLPIYGTGPFMLVVSMAMAILAIPVGLVLTWLIVRPTMRRLSRLTQVSRQFATGDFKVRVGDHTQDEVGRLAQQFDDMADALEQNFGVLRDLAQRNAVLARQAEESAIQAERHRISRDLHDAIAQRLFSLSVSTSTLPDLIQRDQEQGVQQARTIATLAEQTLLDLRALLVDLRPSNVIQHGLADALQALCDEWGKTHRVRIDCSIVLGGGYIPAGIEDVIYRVAQESLSNVIKHAHATAIDMSLVKGQRQITLSVTDNGAGFDPENPTDEGHFGLMSMHERARSVGGAITIESETARGTTLRLVLPLETDVIHG